MLLRCALNPQVTVPYYEGTLDTLGSKSLPSKRQLESMEQILGV